MKKDPNLAAIPHSARRSFRESFDESRAAAARRPDTLHKAVRIAGARREGARDDRSAAAAARSARQAPPFRTRGRRGPVDRGRHHVGSPSPRRLRFPRKKPIFGKTSRSSEKPTRLNSTRRESPRPAEAAAPESAPAAEPQAEIFGDFSRGGRTGRRGAAPGGTRVAHTTLHGTPVTVFEEESREEKVAGAGDPPPDRASVSEHPMELQSFESLDEAHLLGAEFGVPPRSNQRPSLRRRPRKKQSRNSKPPRCTSSSLPRRSSPKSRSRWFRLLFKSLYLQKEAPIAAPSAAAPMVDLDVTLVAIPVPPPPPPVEEHARSSFLGTLAAPRACRAREPCGSHRADAPPDRGGTPAEDLAGDPGPYRL